MTAMTAVAAVAVGTAPPPPFATTPRPLTEDQQAIIKATVPILAQHGEAITTLMYQRLLTENPALNNIFNTVHQETGRQPRALAASLLEYASGIDADPGRLAGLVDLVCHRHASLHVRPDQYAVVGRYLLAAMEEVLGSALMTAEVRAAWAAAYAQLAKIMIDRESGLYQASAEAGWSGGDWREFRIAKKVAETGEITSFYLEPADGRPLPAFSPGQYVSIRLRVPGRPFLQARQYSLSDAHRAEYYRISVRREDGGSVSGALHRDREAEDAVEVSAPSGDFFLRSADVESPIVLISAGVGLTCLLSILNTATSSSSSSSAAAARPISWIHGARSASARAFAAHVRSLAATHPNLRTVFFASAPAVDEVEGRDFDFAGRIDLRRLDRERVLMVADAAAQYFVCGPEEFMIDTAAALGEMGVGGSRVHMELFGTSGVSRV